MYGNKIKFIQITKEKFDELPVVEDNTLYFILDGENVTLQLGDKVLLESLFVSDFETTETSLKLKKSDTELNIPFKTINNQSIFGTGDVTVSKDTVFLVSKGFDEETQTLTVEEV